MNKTLLIIALHIVFLTSAFGQTATDSITMKSSWGMRFYQKGEKLSISKATKMIKSNQVAAEQIKGAKSSAIAGSIISGAGWGLITTLLYQKPNWTMGAIGVGLAAIAIPINIKAIKKYQSAIKTYNDGLKKKPPVLDNNEMKISMSGNGVGLSLTF